MATAFIVLAAICTLLVVIIFSPKQNKPRALAELPEPSADVRRLLGAGQKIQAIKRYRQQTGASLLEAKNVIDHAAPVT